MQLDKNARLLLDVVAASGEPKLWDLTPPEARKKVVELTRMVECKEAIGKIEDRTLPGPAGPLPFRVYTPLAADDEPSGGVIFFHGGAWVLGDLIRMIACAVFSLMRAAAGSFQLIIGLRLSIRSLPPLKMPALQQHG
jgi:acetyl esterase/lipase